MTVATLLTEQELDQEIRMYEHLKFKCEQKSVHSKLTKSKESSE
jgi:hypothetical protein